MFNALLYPLRLPERVLDALDRIVQDLRGVREELAGGLDTLEQTADSLAADVRPRAQMWRRYASRPRACPRAWPS